MSFSKILIANRGEIACRVIRTAHRLGYRTVAVYSEADAAAPHVLQADEAVCIGPAPASESYLRIEALIDAARRNGADAVHPGYGFLSERAEFAEACAAAGLVFIGPPAEAIRAMGDKAGAKRRMVAAGVPCAPGYLADGTEDDQSDTRMAAEAARLGTPLLVKAVAGGGGRGMRLVHDLTELPAALAAAQRKTTNAFGDGTLMLERLIEHGRHIEIQVFADAHGHAVHLGERDCTAQRRRQKVIEESPSPVVSPAMREAMGRDAVAAALAVGYRGAGTVEFIVDAQLQHHFLEMNTRLQVEHPVTECVTGLDLVEWQLRVAAGEPLPLAQADIRFSGHAIEARLVAEDPYDGWTPQTGRIVHWRPEAAVAHGARIDHGIAEGGEVTPFYDAMVAKLIVHGHDRADAVRRLVRALADAPLLGPANNGRFLADLVRHPQFAAAQLTTTRLDEWQAQGEPLLQRLPPPDAAWRVAAALRATRDAVRAELVEALELKARASTGSARTGGVSGFDLTLQCQGERRTLRAPVPGVQVLAWHAGVARVQVDGVTRRVHAVAEPAATGADAVLHLVIDGTAWRFTEPSAHPAAEAGTDPRRARAPVAGVVAQVAVQPGDTVVAGQPLLCVEAMKMEMWLHAAAAGTVKAVNVNLKDAVAAGAVLVELDLEPEQGA